MKRFKKILVFLCLIIGLIIIYFIDVNDRLLNRDNRFSEIVFMDNEYKLGDDMDSDYPKELYTRNFKNKDYHFPRTKINEAIVYKNWPLISRLTKKKLSEQESSDLELFFNSPENFNWGETTWRLSESDFIIRCYDSDGDEIGKIWVCLDQCGMTFSNPFSPNMKYGGLSEIGYKKLESILN